MEDSDNGLRASSGLLSRLHDFYRPGRRSYRKEDLFTEYLAWLLNRSRRFRIAFAQLALYESASVTPETFADAEALTQVDTGDWGRIDLVLEVASPTREGASDGSPDVEARLGVECKVDDRLGEEQPARYHEWLEAETDRCRHVALAALTKKRLGQKRPFDGEVPPYWQGILYWHEVEEALKRCVDQVRSERLAGLDPEEEEFLAAAGFVVIGNELRELMREEGMLAASRIDATDDASLYREFKRYKSRIREILSLVENAIDTADIETLLRDSGEAEILRTEQKKYPGKGRPVSILRHREDPPASFMFGVTVSPPNRYARRPGETFDSEGYEAELIAGYRMHGRSGGSLQMSQELEGIAQTLTAGTGGQGFDVEVFVPENASYQKFVARAPVPRVESADEQAREMGRFYRSFVMAFLETEETDGRPMLEYLRDLHLRAVGGE